MARAVKWSVATSLTVLTFGIVLWVGTLTATTVLPKGWPDTSKVATVLATASLLATIVFGIGRWWAEHDGKHTPTANRPSQHIDTVFGGNGITGNIGGNAHIGLHKRGDNGGTRG